MTAVDFSSIFVGRQAIYDRDINVTGYELLFRSTSENRAIVLDGDVATSQLLVNALVEIGLESLVNGSPAFVNFTRNFLVGRFDIPFEPESLVIEVLESVQPDEEVIAALERLRKGGFTIALDDYVKSDHRQSLLRLADIIKVDISTFDPDGLDQQVRQLKPYPVRLLAEKVETHEEFAQCKGLGFDYFQGYFLSRPQVVEGKTISNNEIAMLQLLVRLRDPEVTFDEVVELVKQDIPLTLKFLRYVNSVSQGTRRKIDSVRQAAIRIGMQKIRQIVSLMVMTGISNKPKPLAEAALVRARMCELVGAAVRSEMSDVCFTVGLFSNLDAFMDRPLEEVLQQLPVTAEFRAAILRREGEMGRVLEAVVAFERGEWDQIPALGLDNSIIQRAYFDAVAWSHNEAMVGG